MSDHLGSTDKILKAAGSTVQVAESFAAYGARRGSDWTGAPSAADLIAIGTTTPEGFTGHEMLDGVGLIHMNGRVYDPAVGRFLSVDPLVRDLGASQSWNGYGYVEGHVLSSTDPSGYDPQCPGGNKTIVNCNPVPPDWWLVDGPWMEHIDVTARPWPDPMAALARLSGMRVDMNAGLGTGGYELPSQTVMEEVVVTADKTRPQGNGTSQVCTGRARVIGNTGSLIGNQGAIPGTVVQPNTAAVIPSQFGLVDNGAAIKPYASSITGTAGKYNFTGVSDVIGGKSPIAGLNVRDALQSKNPGLFIIELYGRPDQNIADVSVSVPAPLTCPTGTSPSTTGTGGN